ncbi:MAG: alpha/beta fold hydrolase [Deltaproteobacteria bacterium]|nr:alpha/beta fold hydrolase [Deltaproteobacteria bacterium]
MRTLLFIHGWATDNFVWEGAAKALGGDKNILNLSLPGHGGREKWDEPTLSPAIKELSSRLSALEDNSIIGVGWSLGAEVLVASFGSLKKKFGGLVLVGATPCFVEKEDFPWGQSRVLVKRMILDMKKDPASTVNRFYGLNFTGTELNTVGAGRFIERYGYPGPLDCTTAVPGCFPVFKYDEITTALEALYLTDIRGALSLIDTPTLIVHGGKDGVTPAGAGRYLADKINGAELKVFKEAGHAPFVTEPQRFNEAVKDFMERL